MQTQVIFNIMPDEADDQHAHWHQACVVAADHYRNNQRVYIYTQNQADAHQIDELLWAFDPDSFVPHNLVGEGPQNGSAVEISWQAPTSRRPILINLTSTVPDFASQFSHIIDFVPADETLKQQARERFKACRQWGFNVDTKTLSVKQSSTG
ncbi:DNA polymerase III subunit chi [Thalassotalea sp. PLHSN55]|uniref:DNA polymerase III subunit chi n=1 Tax=Thalassotalea sp. PLHSN55 TaxID=3435888 RepID=UPI003F8543DD